MLSAVSATTLGVWIGFGLVKVASYPLFQKKHLKTTVMTLLLWPSVLPTLAFLSALLGLFPRFPLGLWGIVIAQTLLYAGVVAYFWQELIQSSLGLYETALVLGTRPTRACWHLLRANAAAVLNLGLVIFISCFVSFSIPITLGAGRSVNLEILIYETLHRDFRSGVALALGLIQFGLLAVISLFLRFIFARPYSLTIVKRTSGQFATFGLFPLFLYLLFAGICMFGLLFQGFFHWPTDPETLNLALMTLLISLGVGIILLLFFSLIIYANSKFIENVLGAMTAPSTALLGASLVCLSMDSQIGLLGLYILLLGELFLPALYRSSLRSKLEQLQRQRQVAEQLGAGSFLTFRKLLWPQLQETVALAAGLGALWAVGDFTLIKVIFTQDLTLAQLAHTQMASYLFDLSSGTLLLSLLCGFVSFFMMRGFVHVTSATIAKTDW